MCPDVARSETGVVCKRQRAQRGRAAEYEAAGGQVDERKAATKPTFGEEKIPQTDAEGRDASFSALYLVDG